MPDPTLHGNGYICTACELRREADRKRSIFGLSDIPCNQCNGICRIANTAAQIVAEPLPAASEET